MEATYSITAALGIAAFGVAVWLLIRWRRHTNKDLQKLLRAVSSDQLIDVIIPDGTGGEIHIDHLLLTPHGLMLLDVKDMQGSIFAGDRMDSWSATHLGARMTFDNPIPLLQERCGAVALLAPGIPIEARVLFTGEATFPKGCPPEVSTVQSLIEEYNAHIAPPQDFSENWRAIQAAVIP